MSADPSGRSSSGKPHGPRESTPAYPRVATRLGRLGLLLALGGAAIAAGLAWRLGPWIKERQLARAALPELARRADTSQRDPLVLYYYGMALLRSGSLPEAATMFERAIDTDPTMARGYTGLGRAIYSQGRSRAAEVMFRQALKLAPADMEPHFFLARLYFDVGQPTLAIPELETCTRLRPRHANLWYTLGQVYARGYKHDRSLEALEKAVKLDGRQPDYWRDLGKAYWDYSRLDDAARCFKRAVALKPSDPVLLLWLGQVYLRRPDTPERRRLAEESFRASARLMPRLAEVHLELGELLIRIQRNEEAEKELREAMRLAPHLDQPLFLLGQLLVRQGRRAEGERYLKAVDELKEVNGRMQSLEDQIQNRPTDPKLRLRLARLYGRYGNTEGARSGYQAYLFLRREDAAVARELARYLREAQKDTSGVRH